MAFLETALDYIVGIVTENEEVKKFPKDFVTASMQWIRSWFLIDDPKMEAKLTDPNRSLDSKKTIIETKLEDLNENPQFVKELTERLAAFELQKTTKRNVIEGGIYKVQGGVHIGSEGNASERQVDEENVIKNAQFDVGGDFRLGNTTHIVHNYFGGTKFPEKTTPQYNDLKSDLKSLLSKGKTDDVVDRLLDITERHDKDAHNTVLLLSAQLSRIKDKETKGLIDNREANIERNRLTNSLITVIGSLDI